MEMVAVVLVSILVSAVVSALVTINIMNSVGIKQLEAVEKMADEAVSDIRKVALDALDKANEVIAAARKK